MTDSAQIEAIEKEYKDIEDSRAWNQVYQRIRDEGTFDLSCTEARKSVNRNLNRYRDVLPYDRTRIVLTDTNTDYINASLVKAECVNRSYVLAQGPLSHTTPHFWLMIWQQKIKGVIMLNKIIEKNQIKCHQYWPLGESEGGEDSIVFSTVGLKVDLLSVSRHTHYNYSTLRLTKTSSGENRLILHFHYTTWPDFGVPQSPEAFYKFLNVVRASGVLEPDVGPAVVHCSAGIGRSGTFCLVDTILMMLSKGLCGSGQGKVVDVLLDMRRQRMGLIQTHDQLRFSYQAIVYGAHKLVEVNGKDPCEESSSEEPSLADESPPQPPPRTDSLTRSMIESQLTQELQDGTGTDTAPEDDEEDFDEDSRGSKSIQNL
uniref:protein-tyrosine-phosphatase n=1 Tax=Scylla olivacea TaxID=85551 RepID=A0A0P4W2M0_SCYOL